MPALIKQTRLRSPVGLARLAKNVRIGYRPGPAPPPARTGGKGNDKRCPAILLKDHHQACTRMIRADYCGDGKAWTVEGTVPDIFDYLDPRFSCAKRNGPLSRAGSRPERCAFSKPRHPELGFTGKCGQQRQKGAHP